MAGQHLAQTTRRPLLQTGGTCPPAHAHKGQQQLKPTAAGCTGSLTSVSGMCVTLDSFDVTSPYSLLFCLKASGILHRDQASARMAAAAAADSLAAAAPRQVCEDILPEQLVCSRLVLHNILLVLLHELFIVLAAAHALVTKLPWQCWCVARPQLWLPSNTHAW